MSFTLLFMTEGQFKQLIETLEKVIPGKNQICDPIGQTETQELTSLYFIWSLTAAGPVPLGLLNPSTLVIPNNGYTSLAKKGQPIDLNSLTACDLFYPSNMLLASYTNFLIEATSPYSRPLSPVLQENGLPIIMGDCFGKAMVNRSFKVKSMELILSSGFGSLVSEVFSNNFPVFPATWNVDKAGPTGNAYSFGGVFTQNPDAVQQLGNGLTIPFQGVSGMKTECDFIYDCQTTMFINFESGLVPRAPFALKMNIEHSEKSTNRILQNNFNSNSNKP